MYSNKIKFFLKEIKKEYGSIPSDLHITRKACALVAISEGRVIKMESPKINYCPLFKALFSYKSINKKTIEKKFERQIRKLGMFTCKRKIFDDKIIVPFGASEMIMYALRRKNVEAAVVVCEGAGTIITSKPEVVQGIGAYMNGVFYTTPVSEVILNLKRKNSYVLSSKDANIDQLKGIVKAIKLGINNIVVTVRGDEDKIVFKIRRLEKKYNVNITILVVCNTGISKKQAETIKNYGDIAWACASKYIRKIVGQSSIIQVGVKIPVFVLTEKGVNFIASYSSNSYLKERLKKLKNRYYITSNKYQEGAVKINMGKFFVYLYETEKLPISTFDEPNPLT